MSTAEEKLEEAREGATLSRHEREDAVYDLAREAIALLRESDDKFDLPHDRQCKLMLQQKWEQGDPDPACDCGTWEYEKRRNKFLDGEP